MSAIDQLKGTHGMVTGLPTGYERFDDYLDLAAGVQRRVCRFRGVRQGHQR